MFHKKNFGKALSFAKVFFFSPHPRSPSPKERGAVRSSAVNFEF